MEDNCPKCGSKIRLKNHSTGVNRWYCGTIGPDSKGEYLTSLLCDHTVAMNLLRSAEMVIHVMYEKAERDKDWNVTSFLHPYKKILEEFLEGKKDDLSQAEAT